ncbi:MAG: barstar family protein [Planctomycetota bacterium]|jgi:RNAse (barnase) inhibitor barstar
MAKKKFEIDGSSFNDLKSFYDEVEKVLCPNLDFRWGRNLNAFNDILLGGFGSFEPEETIDLVWKDSGKSKINLGLNLFDTLIQIIKDNSHINLIVE